MGSDQRPNYLIVMAEYLHRTLRVIGHLSAIKGLPRIFSKKGWNDLRIIAI